MPSLRFHAVLTAVICVCSHGVVKAQAHQSGLERVTVAPDVHLIQTPFDGYVLGNSIIIVNSDHVVVFDSNTRPSTARDVIREIRRITPLPVRFVINSHWHPDHWTGNEAYAAEFPGVQFIATQASRDVMANVAPAWPASFAGSLARQKASLDSAIRTGKQADGSVLSAAGRRDREASVATFAGFVQEVSTVVRYLPTITYVDSMTLYGGGREIRLTSQTGDADGSTVVYLPREKVLLSGDLLVHPVQWTTQSFRISPWIASLRELAKLDVTAVVPGHGPVFRDRRYLVAVADFFDAARTQVLAALRAGAVTVADVERTVNLDAHRQALAEGDPEVEEALRGTVSQLVRKLYLEARGGMESRR